MVLPVNNNLKQWNVDFHVADITTSGATAVAFAPVPFTGALHRLYCTQYASISGVANTLTVSVNGVTVSGVAERFANGTDAAAGVYTELAAFTPVSVSGGVAAVTRFRPQNSSGISHPDGYPVSEGDAISILSDGAGTNSTIPCTFSAILKRI